MTISFIEISGVFQKCENVVGGRGCIAWRTGWLLTSRVSVSAYYNSEKDGKEIQADDKESRLNVG